MMTWQQFDARLTTIEDQAQARQERVDGYRDQRMAKLFSESERSQEELAEHLSERWGKAVSACWVQYHLRFGRFISFFNTGCVEDEAPAAQFRLPANLTEGAFRRFWDATEAGGNFSGHKANTEAAVKDERRRFGEVVEQLKDAGLRRKAQPIREAIVEELTRSEWLTLEEIAQRISPHFDRAVKSSDVYWSLFKMRPNSKIPFRVEKIGDGKSSAKYRIVKVKGQVTDPKRVAQYAHEVIPMMESLIREAQKDRVSVSLSELCSLASRIKKVMENMTAEVPIKE